MIGMSFAKGVTLRGFRYLAGCIESSTKPMVRLAKMKSMRVSSWSTDISINS